MKILIVSKYFFPVNTPRAFRTTELAKEFSRQGHEVTVITPKMDEHVAFSKKHGVKIKNLGSVNWKPFKLQGRGAELIIRRALKRFSKLFFEYPELEFFFKVRNKLKNERNYDLLISIAVPFTVHWGVAAVWKNTKENPANFWIADCGDPYMGAENDTFKPPFYFKYIEKWFCKKVSFLTVPVETAINAYYPEFHFKTKVIPQGFRFEDIKVGEVNTKPYPHFAYAGGLIPGKREPKEFFEYLLNTNKEYQFDIYTNSTALVKPYEKRSNGRIRIKPYMPRTELMFELSKLDFVVNFENAGNKQIPSKLIDYSIINRPILSVNSQNFNRHFVDEFLNGDYSNGLVLENLEHYRIENVASSFTNLIDH